MYNPTDGSFHSTTRYPCPDPVLVRTAAQMRSHHEKDGGWRWSVRTGKLCHERRDTGPPYWHDLTQTLYTGWHIFCSPYRVTHILLLLQDDTFFCSFYRVTHILLLLQGDTYYLLDRTLYRVTYYSASMHWGHGIVRLWPGHQDSGDAVTDVNPVTSLSAQTEYRILSSGVSSVFVTF